MARARTPFWPSRARATVVAFNPRDLADVVSYRGFWRFARRHWRIAAAEVWRDVLEGLVPRRYAAIRSRRPGGDITFGPSGIRAQALSRAGDLVDDFVFDSAPSVIHVLNAPSPAATASLAIGDHIASMAVDQFGLA